MALLQNEVRELISQKWRPETPRMGSLIHQLFPNEIQFTDFEYGKDVIIPLATDGVINRTWDPQTGSKSNYAENKFVKAKLDQVIDIQERIGKYESKALTPKFLENKLNRLQLQSAEIYDKYDAANLVKDGTAVTDAQPITKANILDETTKMRIFTVNNQNEFTNGFLIATSDVVSYATQAKIMSNAPDGVLNIINGVVGVINGCYVIEVPKSRLPEDVSMIWVNPTAYATYTGIDLPFSTGIYTDEKYMGQVYLAEREFFTGKVAVPLSVIYHKATPPAPDKSIKNQIITDKDKTNKDKKDKAPK
ncbi:MAG: hypothetical protein PPFGHCPK_01103 [Spiroplasma endosymbiont of Drosophila atripex]|nr:MAG: hypothetical protein PPFGHCPK_01103 [Spiroplasma endosymbiont of Drosophila atripex]